MQQLLKFYGISQDPSTGEYIFVTQYAEHGSLHLLLHRHFSSFSWTEKIWWLCDIISNLLTLHKAGIVHGNIHSGNVLQIGDLARETTSALSDTGLNHPASPSSSYCTEATHLPRSSIEHHHKFLKYLVLTISQEKFT
jgi:serine/threonine protein kinase